MNWILNESYLTSAVDFGMWAYGIEGKMDRRVLLHLQMPTGTLNRRGLGYSKSMNWVLTNWQDGSCLCSLVAILEENIAVRYARGRILILIILLEEQTRSLLRCLLQAVAPLVSSSHILKGRSQTGMGRMCKQRHLQGTCGPGLGCCGGQKRARPEQAEPSNRLCCLSNSHTQPQCPSRVVICGTRRLKTSSRSAELQNW